MNNEDAPRLQFQRTTVVKATRKPHECSYCHGPIEVGSKAMYTIFKTDEDPKPVTFYEHWYSPSCRLDDDG